MRQNRSEFPPPFQLRPEIALITGGSTGLGFGIAKCFVQSGARVILVGRNTDRLKSACSELGESAAWLAHDVTQLDRTPSLIEKAALLFGEAPGILVSNAGNHLKKSAMETSSSEFEEVMRTHATAGHALAAAILPRMIERDQGSILFISSMTNYLGIPNVFAYTAAKTALAGMTRALASEVSGRGVRVNAIAPGWIESPMLHAALFNDQSRKRKILSRTLMGMFGKPEDIGWAAVYLCSPAAKFITGIVLPVDGGASIGF